MERPWLLGLASTEGLGVRSCAPTLDLGGEFSNGYFFKIKKSLSLRCVVATPSPELTKKANGIDDTEFSHERISRSLRYLGDWIKVCTHCNISETKPRMDMGVTLRP